MQQSAHNTNMTNIDNGMLSTEKDTSGWPIMMSDGGGSLANTSVQHAAAMAKESVMP